MKLWCEWYSPKNDQTWLGAPFPKKWCYFPLLVWQGSSWEDELCFAYANISTELSRILHFYSLFHIYLFMSKVPSHVNGSYVVLKQLYLVKNVVRFYLSIVGFSGRAHLFFNSLYPLTICERISISKTIEYIFYQILENFFS